MLRKILSKFIYRRGYKNNSPNWAFLQGFKIPHIDNPEVDYLWRLRIINTPWFGIMLHKINTPDARDTLHDHPWSMLSLILRGGYVEFVPGPYYAQSRVVKRINWKPRASKKNPLSSFHWIAEVDRTPTWTLVFVGPRRKDAWGYLDRDGVFTPFNEHPYNDEYQKALEYRAGGGDMM